MSERSIQLQSQPGIVDGSTDSTGLSIIPQDLSQAQRHAKKKPEFARFACSHSQVGSFHFLLSMGALSHVYLHRSILMCA